MRLEEVILRDTRANQPVATDVAAGTLYYVTDESVTERSTGAAWESFSDAGAVANNSITDAKLRDSAAVSVIGRSANSAGDPADIAAGANNTFLKRIGDALSFATVDLATGDVVNDLPFSKIAQASTDSVLLGRGDSGAGDFQEITLGTNLSITGTTLDAAGGGGGSSDWDTEVIKPSDQSVVNNAVLQNDADLVSALLNNSTYLVEFIIIYNGSSTAVDIKWQFTLPITGAQNCIGHYLHVSTSLAVAITPDLGATGVFPGTARTSGTDNAQPKFVIHGRVTFTTTSAANIQFQFANNTAAVGATTTVYAGSRLRIKKLT